MSLGALSTHEDVEIGWEDILVIVLYFVIVLGVGFYASCRAKTDDAEGYFLAGRSTTWIPMHQSLSGMENNCVTLISGGCGFQSSLCEQIGASTFATNIGAPMFIGLAGSAAAGGIAVVMFEWHAMFMLILLGWLFLPVYMSSGCYTMPQYLKYRFGGQRIRVWLAVVHTFLTIISQIAGQVYAGALFITQIFQWDLYGSVIFILGITALYTVIGGLTAVIWTDTIQTVILIIGSIILGAMSLDEVGGFNSMRVQYMSSAANYTFRDISLYDNRTCGWPRDDAFHIFRAPDADYPWPGMIGGLTILALNAWCTDQICVQRSLSAKSISHAKAGVLLAAYLKALPFFFFIIPGMISRVLYPQEIACADPVECEAICDNPKGCTNIAYPLLVLRILPNGVRGIMLAALLAALMSSLTSIFNSSSSLFTMDIWRRIRPAAKQGELMVVGRLWTVVLMVVGILWLPILLQVQGSNFWDYTQAISSYILPPVVMVFLMGIFWKRTTEQGAFAGLVIGFAIGIIRMGLEWSVAAPSCGSGEENDQFIVVQKVHYLHFAIILGVISVAIIFLVSLLTEPRKPSQLHRVTWWTRNDTDLPEVSDDSDIEDDEQDDSPEHAHGAKHVFCKYVCGVDKTKKRERLTPEEYKALQLKLRNIEEDPQMKTILDINMIICAAAAVFLHAFWA